MNEFFSLQEQNPKGPVLLQLSIITFLDESLCLQHICLKLSVLRCSLDLVFLFLSSDILKGNHLNYLKTHLISSEAMISIQIVFSLLNIYVNICMHMSSDVQCLRSEHTNTKKVTRKQMSIEQQLR